jgi:hypothetical protein
MLAQLTEEARQALSRRPAAPVQTMVRICERHSIRAKISSSAARNSAIPPNCDEQSLKAFAASLPFNSLRSSGQ